MHPHGHRNRRSLRLPDYDYSQEGVYFVTLCTWNRAQLFGKIDQGSVRLFELGEAVAQYWLEIPRHFPDVKLDEFAVMPNHVHGIIIISRPSLAIQDPHEQADLEKPRGTSRTVGSIIRGFKIGVTKWARAQLQMERVWQRNYFERIIRGEGDLRNAREYILNNPLQWQFDHENPNRVPRRQDTA